VTIIGATDDFFSKLANAIADSISNAMKSQDSENKAGAGEDKLKLKPKEGNTKLAGATKIGGGFQAASGDVMQGGLLGGIAALLNPKAIMDMLKGLGKKLLKVISDVVENIVKIFTSVFDSVKSVVQNIAKRIGSIFEGIMGAIEGLISKLPGPIKKFLGVGEKGVVKGAEGTATKAIATKGVETAAAKTAIKAGSSVAGTAARTGAGILGAASLPLDVLSIWAAPTEANAGEEDTLKKMRMMKQKGPSTQTQSINQMSKQNQAAKETKAAAPSKNNTNITGGTVVNNTNTYLGNPTIGAKGSLDLATFA
jgi:hypothetical protein